MNKKELLEINKKYMITLGHQSLVTNKKLNNLVTLLRPSNQGEEVSLLDKEKMHVTTLLSYLEDK